MAVRRERAAVARDRERELRALAAQTLVEAGQEQVTYISVGRRRDQQAVVAPRVAAQDRAGRVAADPVEVGFFDTPGDIEGVAVSGNHAYVTNSNDDVNDGLRVIDPRSGKDVWRPILEGELAVVAEGGPSGEVEVCGPIQKELICVGC